MRRAENREYLYPLPNFTSSRDAKSYTAADVTEWTAFTANLKRRVSALAPEFPPGHPIGGAQAGEPSPASPVLPATFVCGNVSYAVNSNGAWELAAFQCK